MARDVCVLHHLIYGCHYNVIAFANERGKRQFSTLYGVLRQANAALHHCRVNGGMIPAISVGIRNHLFHWESITYRQFKNCFDRHQILVESTQRRRTIIGKPPFGRSVTLSTGHGVWPDAISSVKLRMIVAMTIEAS